MPYGPNTPLVLVSDVVNLLPGASADSSLPLIVAGVSDLARRYCSRSFLCASYSEQYRGTNNNRLYTRQHPIQFVGQLTIGTASGNFQINGVSLDGNGFPFPSASGYWFDDKSIYLGSNAMSGGLLPTPTRFVDSSTSNVFLNYIAGYLGGPVTTYTGFTVPAVVSVPTTGPTVVITVGTSAVLTIGSNYMFAGAGLFTIQGIVDLTHVTATNPGGGNAATGFVTGGGNVSRTDPQAALPGDLYEAICYECAIRHKELTRLGLKASAMGGETTTYSVTSLQPETKDVLNRYRRVTGAV